MAEQTNPPAPQDQPTTPAPRKKKKRRRGRKILIGIGVIVLLLILLVILAPTIIASGWARGLVISKVNDQLNGTLAIGDWDMGWFSPIRAENVVVKDPAGNVVASIDSLTTDLTVLEAARQKFDLGQVVIDGLKANIIRHADGSTNLDNLVKPSPADGKTADGKTDTTSPDDSPTTLPDLNGNLIIKNSGGTFKDESAGKSATFDLSGEVKIPGTNQPISNDLKLAVKVGDAPTGNIAITGKATIAQNNIIKIDPALMQQTVKADGIDAEAFAFLLPPDAGIDTIAGLFSANVEVQGSEDAVVATMLVKGQNVAVGGSALKGDTFKSDVVTITLPPTRVPLQTAGGDFNTARIVIGDGGKESQPMVVQWQQGKITVAADATAAGLMNLAANQAPGSEGRVNASVNVDIGAMARQLPHLMKINEELTDLQGRLVMSAEVALEPKQALPMLSLNLSDVQAKDAKTNKVVRLKPVELRLSARHLGGGGALPDLRDIAVKLASGFATADIKGPNLGSINGRLNGTLDAMQAELGQFVDFGNVKLAGAFDATINSDGQLTEPGGSSVASVAVNLNDLTIEGLADVPAVRKQRLQMAMGGTLKRGEVGGVFLTGIDNPTAMVQAGDANRPWFDLALKGDAVRLLDESSGASVPVTVTRFDLSKLAVDLVAAQQQVAAISQLLKDRGVGISNGAINLTTSGSFDRDVLTLAGLNLTTQDITAEQNGRQVIERLTLALDLAGRVGLGKEATTINLSRLNLTEARNFITIKKTSGGELAITLPAAGGFAGQGQLQFGLSLGFANDLVRAMQTEVVAETAAGQIKRGFLDGTIDLNQPDAASPTTVALDAKIHNLTVTTETGNPVEAKEITLVAAGSMSADQSQLSVSKVDLSSPFATVALRDAAVDMATDNPMAMIKSAGLTVDVPDAASLWSVYEALVPQVKEELPPLRITGGKLHIESEIKQDNGQLAATIKKITGEGVALSRGEAKATLEPFTLSLAARVQADAAGQLQQLLVNQLDADFGFAKVKATEPLKLVGLDSDKPQINGALTGQGDLERVLALVNLMGASVEKPAYAGAFNFEQKVNTRDGKIALDGSANVRDIKSLADGGKSIKEEVRFANRITLDTANETLAIETLDLSLPQTQALAMNFGGTIKQYSTKRQLDLKGTLKTDWERLWQLAYPLLSAESQKELADAKFFGIEQREFILGGFYPADKEFNEAIRTVTASGGIGIKSASAMGIDLREVDAPFSLKDGQVTLGFAPQKTQGVYIPNAQINDGVLNLGNIVLDLTGASITLTTPKDYKLMMRASLNPVLADKIIGKVVNPMFTDAKQAKGQINVVIAYCEALALDQLALGDATESALQVERKADRSGDAFDQWKQGQKAGGAAPAQANTPAGPGRAKVLLSINQLQIGNPVLDQLVGVNLLDASVQDAEIAIDNGVVTSKMPVTVRTGDKQFATMVFDGKVRMADSKIINMDLAYPKELLPKALREALGDQALKFVPANIVVPFTGTLDAPQFNLGEAVQKSLVGGAGGGLGNVLEDLIKGGKKDKK